MDTKLVSTPIDQVQADALAVVLFEDRETPADVKAVVASWLDELRTSSEFTGKPGELAILHQPKGLAAKRLVVVGGGKQEKFDAAALRRSVGATVRTLKQKGVKSLAWILNGASAEAAVEGALLGNYEPDHHKTSTDNKSLESLSVVGPVTLPVTLKDDVVRGTIL